MPDSGNSSHLCGAPAPADEVIDIDAAWAWLIGIHNNAPSGADISSTAVHGLHDQSSVTDGARELLGCLSPLAYAPAWTIAQLGQSLDGRIATESGHSHYINGTESLVHLHRLRALADAVVIGAGTAAADNPQLTVRHVSGRHPTRVILDPRGRVPSHLTLLTCNDAPTLHITGPDTNISQTSAENCVLPLDANGRFVPDDVIALLAERGLKRVLVEGGGITVSHFIEAAVVDRLHLLVAPLLIGSGRPGLQMTPIDTLESALRPSVRLFSCGNDTLFDIELRTLTRGRSILG